LVHRFGENRISVMNEDTVCVVRGDGFTKLLNDPLGSGMGSHIDMQQLSAAMFDHHEHIEHTKSRSDCHTEVTRDDALGVIAKKGRPTLRLAAFTRSADAVIGHVFAYGSWRDL
jgi:hypothetical protein